MLIFSYDKQDKYAFFCLYRSEKEENPKTVIYGE